tara:strand:- start:1835 stop:1936 length:102 start_codon:yes stop_codon:yes gene_type:complete
VPTFINVSYQLFKQKYKEDGVEQKQIKTKKWLI